MTTKLKLGMPAVALIALGTLAGSARADEVVYTTTGSFTCPTTGLGATGCHATNGASSSSVTVASTVTPRNALTLTYNAVPSTTLTGSPVYTGESGGFLVLTLSGNGGAFPTTGVGFSLTINQNSPTVGSGGFSGAIKGSVRVAPAGAGAILTFTNTTITLGNVVYTITGLGPGNTLSFSGTSSSSAVISLTITDLSFVPEPTFLVLTGIGFAGLSFIAYRRNRQQKRAA